MGIPQQKSLQLCRHSPMLSSFHIIPTIFVWRTIHERYGTADPAHRRARELDHRSLRIVPSSLVSFTNFSKLLLYNSLSNSWASSGSNQKTLLAPVLVRVSRT